MFITLLFTDEPKKKSWRKKEKERRRRRRGKDTEFLKKEKCKKRVSISSVLALVLDIYFI